jgi:superfamily I DNA/RNA helicase
MPRHPHLRVYLGPPGTGKTTTLMGLMEEELARGTEPERIGFVSFTKAAVGEAKSRAVTRFGLDPQRFEGFRTIHGQALALIGGRADVLTAADMKAFEAKYGYGLTPEKEGQRDADEPGEPPKNTDDDHLRAAVDWARVRRVSIEEGLRTFDGTVRKVQDVLTFADRYARFKGELGRMDFTDMLERCLERQLARRRDVLFVDEVQDLSPLQIAVVQQWIAAADRVYIAGDDDQAIYGFGGAEPDWLIQLSQEYPTTILDQSWRVPEGPHAVAQAIIRRNSRRVQKEYRPRKATGSVVPLTRSAALASIVVGEPTFILCRNVSTVRSIVGDLFHTSIPYVSERGGINPLGRAKLLSAFNTAVRVHRRLPVTWAEFGVLCEFVPWQLLGPRKTKGEIADRATRFPEMVMDWTLSTLRSTMDADGPASVLVLDGVDDKTRAYLTRLLGTADEIPQPSVVVTTIHASKGREKDHVLVCEDHSYAVERTLRRDPEAENRIAYVAVTRTKNRLTIIRRSGDYGYRYPVEAATTVAPTSPTVATKAAPAVTVPLGKWAAWVRE